MRVTFHHTFAAVAAFSISINLSGCGGCGGSCCCSQCPCSEAASEDEIDYQGERESSSRYYDKDRFARLFEKVNLMDDLVDDFVTPRKPTVIEQVTTVRPRTTTKAVDERASSVIDPSTTTRPIERMSSSLTTPTPTATTPKSYRWADEIRAQKIPGREWCEYTDPRSKDIISIVKTREGVKIEGKCWKLGKEVKVEEEAPKEVVTFAESSGDDSMKCEPLAMRYSTAVDTRRDNIVKWACENVGTPDWWKKGMREAKVEALSSKCVLKEPRISTRVELVVEGDTVITNGNCPNRQRKGGRERIFRIKTPKKVQDLGREMLKLNGRLDCNQLIHSWIPRDNVDRLEDAIKDVCGRDILLPKWLEDAKKDGLLDERKCRIADSRGRLQEVTVYPRSQGSRVEAEARCHIHTGIDQQKKPLLTLRIRPDVMRGISGAKSCTDALTEFVPDGVSNVGYAISYICTTNLPENGEVQWQTQVISSGSSCIISAMTPTDSSSKPFVKLTREAYSTPNGQRNIFSLEVRCKGSQGSKRISIPYDKKARLEEAAKSWHCGAGLAQFLAPGRVSSEVSPDMFTSDVCRDPQLREMQPDEQNAEDFTRRGLQKIQSDYLRELWRRQEAERLRRAEEARREQEELARRGYSTPVNGRQPLPTPAPGIVRGPSMSKTNQTATEMGANLRRGAGTLSCYFQSDGVTFSVARTGTEVKLSQTGCRGSSLSTATAPQSTAASMARGDGCGIVLGTLASTNQEKAAFAAAVCKTYFSSS